jgi:uncharacterized protein (DUF433 family)
MEQVLDKHIVIDAAICHGRPHIAGHRIRVQDIVVWHERSRMNADEIGATYNLSLAEIYAALSYYFDHKEDIDQALAADYALIEELRAKQTPLLETQLGRPRG